MKMPFQLVTNRLILREFTLADLDFVADLMADPEVMRYYPKTCNRAEAAQWIERQLQRYRDDGHGIWLVLDRETRRPLGRVGLAMQAVDGQHEPEIGWMIARADWRRGIAAEAAAATRNYAFYTREFRRVISLVRPINVPSQGVALKIGMQPERETTFHNYRHLVFALTRDAVDSVSPRPETT